ncbi:MAG: indolepyruvate ferredoxin oxidoreductase subunit alpha [Deltaproteobacteria bacterium]|nr:indolepyruvate ferredoxin oxidoreductase subunit alpha [Deltaproteobacteria bacterium]
MKVLLEDRPGHEILLMGNHAIARGAIEGGLEVATAYPGTPSSEIADTFYALSKVSDLYFEYSTNEKVALEVAAGAAIAGMRSIVSMKHVGLNVAADPLNTLPYTGVKAGMVVVTADEPSMHSSINEQDNRNYARLTLLPCLEPSDPPEALAVARAAFALSEELELPVILRTTTRVSHTRQTCTFGETAPRRFRGHFDKLPRWAPIPRVARQARIKLLEKQQAAIEAMGRLGFDRIEGTNGELGIITSGAAYCYVKDVLAELELQDRFRVLKLTSMHPLPDGLIVKFARSCREILVVEETEPFVETLVRAAVQQAGVQVVIQGKGEQWIPRHWELNPDRIRPAIARLAGVEAPTVMPLEPPPLPVRPPVLCPGCSHRSTYYAVRSVAEPDTYYSSDIGCYSLGLGPPLETADSYLCMGGSVTMACGVSIRNPQPHVAFIGDSTFFHSGLTGLVNAVHNRHDLLLVILDNSTTAMTGHQPHPASDLDREAMSPVDLVRAVRGAGVDDVTVVDPDDLGATIKAFDAAYRRTGVRVLVTRHVCPLFERRVLGVKNERLTFRIDHDACKFCGHHINHEPCSVPIRRDDEIMRARKKIETADLGPLDFPAEGTARIPKSAPCSFACPANICVFGYLSLARAERHADAIQLIRERVPMPATLGRVCHRPCEPSCVRGDYDQPIAINEVKRFVAERESEAAREAHFADLREHAAANANDQRVAVVGAGPSGLAAAHDLAVRGFGVTLFEKERVPGGLLVSGIPPYRLPRDIVTREITDILSLGVELRTGAALGRDFTVSGLLDSEGFDAVCLALGAHQGVRLAVVGEEAEGVEEALWFLRRVYIDKDQQVGRQVLVVGGGDAAIDASRTALRLGARKVQIAYRRSPLEMPAAHDEVKAALEEGIEIQYLTVPVGFEVEDGRVVGARCVRTELGEPDRSGRRRPVPVPDSEVSVAVDHVIVAAGQQPEPDSLANDVVLDGDERGMIATDPETGQTSDPRVFAAGDVTGTGWTVIAAIAHGQRAAAGIDRFLNGDRAEPLELHRVEELPDEQRYHPPIVAPADRTAPSERDPGQRSSDFEATGSGLTADQVRAEAERCLSCGQCARCNNCLDNFGCPAIYKRDGQVMIDQTLCIGCGVCAQLCPNDAIVPVKAGAGG